MSKKLVLFGAGVYAKMYKSLLDYLQIPFAYYTDNDSSKFGTELYGKKVISPQELVALDCQILISCTHGEQIKQQLADMGISNKLIYLESICERLSEKPVYMSNFPSSETQKDSHIIVDMYEGVGWGGTEVWASDVAAGLAQNGYQVALFGSQEQPKLDAQREKMAERFSGEDTIEHMINRMAEKLPFVLLNNFSGCAYLAAVMIKMQYPDAVTIINVIHNDNKSLFQAHMMFRKWVDRFVCVSDKIRRTIINDYQVNPAIVFFKEQPIEAEQIYERSYKSNGTLRIGYAARLVRQQKRADQFPALIDKLEEKKIDYCLEIAGDGECLPALAEYVCRKKLAERVILLGRIGKQEMPEFWKRQDVYLNFSEYEGTSLSMLEAMGYACVPVVTDVSGVSEFIKNGENGFVLQVGDLEGIGRALETLAQKRSFLQKYGECCRKEILSRCRRGDYISYISSIIEGALLKS